MVSWMQQECHVREHRLHFKLPLKELMSHPYESIHNIKVNSTFIDDLSVRSPILGKY
jgi:hypothetical protein